MSEVTRILSAIDEGDPSAAEKLLPLVYDELRRLAAQWLAQEKPGQTVQATALVHEAYVRLVDVEKAQHWNSRGHFFAAAAEAMRRVLVDQARRKQADKRGGQLTRVSLDAADVGQTASLDDTLAIDEALTRLAAEDAQAARLIELRYFAGLSIEEAAELVGLSRSSAYEHWAFARVRLRCLLQDEQKRAQCSTGNGSKNRRFFSFPPDEIEPEYALHFVDRSVTNMPADLQRARELFLHAVGKLSPPEWEAYLAQTCGPDAELHRHVAQLLRVHQEAGSF